MQATIDSVYLAVADLEAASRPYERLGLKLSPSEVGRLFHVGGPASLIAFHFLADAGMDSPLFPPLRQALGAGRSLFAVALRVADLEATLNRLESKGIQATTLRSSDQHLAWLPLHEQAGTDLVLVQHAQSTDDRHAQATCSGLLDHSFPLKQLDHLATVTPDLETKTRFWVDVLGLSVTGEVTTPMMVIRQLRIGDAVLELLGPASPDSPLWKRPPGLVGMASWEVEDLDAVVAQARAAGFSVPDPAVGVLPGTRIATIPAAELAGVNMQLLEYV
jgi:catechol 2,3-dioxygenase-like lactoylglutathione lyase family enzyme